VTDEKSIWKRAWESFFLFLKIGATSFGGPAASTAIIQHETVEKRKWLTHEHFLDLLAAVNLVPGPNSTEMAIHVGFTHAGWPGLILSGAAFIFPAFLISLALAWVYTRFGSLPQVSALFYGINPAVLAIILTACYRLWKSAVKGWVAALAAGVCFAASLLGVDEVIILLAAGAFGVLISGQALKLALLPLPLYLPMAAPLLIEAASDKLVRMGLFFLKVGALLFGSGMVLFAFIQRDVVETFGWLSQQQLIDAIAVGQMTPGPVLSSATFIGYLVAGLPGALVATIGVFLPSFLIVAFLGFLIPRLQKNPLAKAFLKGVNLAVVALILSVCVSLARSAVIDLPSLLIFAVALLALLRFKVDAPWVVVGGALLGLARLLLGY